MQHGRTVPRSWCQALRACRVGNMERLRAMLRGMKDAQSVVQGSLGRALLGVAALWGNIRALRELVGPPWRLSLNDPSPKTNPLLEACRGSRTHAVEWILRHGAAADAAHAGRRYPAHCEMPAFVSCEAGATECLHVLLASGLVAAFDLAYGVTSCQLSIMSDACRSRNPDIFELALQAGASAHAVLDGSDLVAACCVVDFAHGIRTLLRLYSRDYLASATMLKAFSRGKWECVETLLDGKAVSTGGLSTLASKIAAGGSHEALEYVLSLLDEITREKVALRALRQEYCRATGPRLLEQFGSATQVDQWGSSMERRLRLVDSLVAAGGRQAEEFLSGRAAADLAVTNSSECMARFALDCGAGAYRPQVDTDTVMHNHTANDGSLDIVFDERSFILKSH